VTPFDVYERIVALAATAPHTARLAAMRAEFEARTGAFGAEDPWFEARSRAFWDDALTRQRFARDVAASLAEAERAWALAFDRAHRGLFRAKENAGTWVLCDEWSGAELLVDAADDGSREALHAAAGLFDARVAAIDEPLSVAILPGALFHPENATESIASVLDAARGRALEADDVLDALMRMERRFRSLSRVKAGYAYRAEGLP
jgi:hypothetical protein